MSRSKEQFMQERLMQRKAELAIQLRIEAIGNKKKRPIKEIPYEDPSTLRTPYNEATMMNELDDLFNDDLPDNFFEDEE